MRAFEIFEARQNYHGSDLVNKADDPGWGMAVVELHEEFENSDLESFFSNYLSNPLYTNELKQGQSEVGDWFVEAHMIPAKQQSKLILTIKQISLEIENLVFKKEVTREGMNFGAIVFKNKEAAEEFAILIKTTFSDEFTVVVKQ